MTPNYLIRYYLYIAKNILSKEESSRIQTYAATKGNYLSNIISILKVNPLKKSNNKNNNIYYIYSNKDKNHFSF